MLQVNTPVSVRLKWSFNGSGDADGEWYIFGSVTGLEQNVKIHLRDFCKVPEEDVEKVSAEDAKKIFLKLQKDSIVDGILQTRRVRGKLEYFLSSTNRIVDRKGRTVFSLNS